MARELMNERDLYRQLAKARGEQLDRVGVQSMTMAEMQLMGALVEDITQRFSRDEIETLAMQIGIDPEEIAGDTATAKARELVRAADRRNVLQVLIDEIAKERP